METVPLILWIVLWVPAWTWFDVRLFRYDARRGWMHDPPAGMSAHLPE